MRVEGGGKMLRYFPIVSCLPFPRSVPFEVLIFHLFFFSFFFSNYLPPIFLIVVYLSVFRHFYVSRSPGSEHITVLSLSCHTSWASLHRFTHRYLFHRHLSAFLIHYLVPPVTTTPIIAYLTTNVYWDASTIHVLSLVFIPSIHSPHPIRSS